MPLSITTLGINGLIATLSIPIQCHFAQIHILFIVVLSAIVRMQYAECPYAECRHAKCHGTYLTISKSTEASRIYRHLRKYLSVLAHF